MSIWRIIIGVFGKNMSNVKFLLCLALIAIQIFAGCIAVGKKRTSESKEFHYSMPIGARELPPAVVFAKEPAEPAGTMTQQSMNLPTAHTQSEAERGGWGYRIQILSTLNQDEAEIATNEAKKKLGMEVFTEFDPPYHKVRLGNCRDQNEAAELLYTVKRSGYPDAWIVRARVISE